MNNKNLGNEYEMEVVSLLCFKNFWAHFIVPDKTGAQPFDVIAVKKGKAYAIDCKTCVLNKFTIGRLEENQKMAFDRWLACGNTRPLIAVKHNEKTKWIDYRSLKELTAIPLNEEKIEKDMRIGWVYDEILEDSVICML